MEPQKRYTDNIQEIYNGDSSHRVVKSTVQLLGSFKNRPEDISILIDELNDQSAPIHNINFQNWSHFARMLIKAVNKTKNAELLQKTSCYLLKATHFFFPFQINQNNYKSLQPLLKLLKPIKFKKPAINQTDSKHIILYLQSQPDQNWTNQLTEYINNQILVDKKNQNSKNLKISPLLGKFISGSFGKFVPQLERLMVRSQNNFEVLVEFLEACGGSLLGVGQHALGLIKKYKNLYQTKPQLSLRFMKSLTSSLNQQNSFYQAFEFIKTLISSQHNSKKKIIYFRMLEGLVQAQKKFKHSPKMVNEIVACVVVSWAKFTQQSEANPVFQLLDELLPLVSQPGPEIAQLCKPSLKSVNKYILIFTGLTLSFCYKRAEHFEEFASVKQCFNTLKSLLPGFLKKKQSSWHFILPIMNFLSTNDLQIVEDLTQVQFAFKKSILALLPIQQRDALDLITNKYLKYLQKNAQGQRIEIASNICITIIVLLQNNNSQQIWKNTINGLNNDTKTQLVQKGLFPLIYLQTQPIPTKNRINKFISLSRFLIQNIKSLQLINDPSAMQKFLIVASYANQRVDGYYQQDKKQVWRQISEKYILLSLVCLKLREENEKQYITPVMHELNIKLVDYLLNIGKDMGLKLLNQILSKLLDKQYYQKDRSFIKQFQNKLKQTKAAHFQTIYNPCKQILTQMQFYNEQKPVKRKVYLNHILQAKMMSQAQVKQQQYRQHIQKMLEYFNLIVNQILLKNIKNSINIWQNNFQGFIHIVSYPQHRMAVYKLVKSTFQNFNIQNTTKYQQKQYLKIKKLFLRYSNFFADFYSIRGAHMTPPVALMQKSQRFYTQFLDTKYGLIPKDHFSVKFINDLSYYVLNNMEFDLSVKELALNYFNSIILKGQQIQNIQYLYTLLVKNLNIISTCESTENVLFYALKNIETKRYGELFVQILNYVNKTKKLILQSLLRTSQSKGQTYEPTFQDYIKLRILALDDSTQQQISKTSQKLLTLTTKNSTSIKTTIAHFDMKNFIKNNTKDTIQKLCKFMKQSITNQNIDDVFALVLRTAEELYDGDFDQEGLEFLPYFLSLNIDIIPEKFLHKIFEILILKYTANEQYATLSKMSVDIGISIIKQYAKQSGQKMLATMESFLNKAKGISNIVFLGVLAPYLKGNKNLSAIQKRITQLFKADKQSQQCAIAKCIPDLMSFFKNPQELVSKIFQDISKMEQKAQIGQSYLASGLLKGLGAKKTLQYLEKLIAEDYPAKTKSEKIARCLFFRALIENFGRVIELKGFKIIEIVLHYMSDQIEEVRNFSKTVAQIFVTKMSSYSIKQLLPHLLSGLQNEQNWRIKISYIWILGIMANCSAKQLQTSLPVIVPTLSGCLSNAHPAIRDKASEALGLIGQTIKNPEISNSIKDLIEALQNPFEKSAKAIDILLKTRFSHYIDPPSLSIIVPIVDYCLRGRVSELKQGACQVIGSISQLILNPSDMLPYLKYVGPGIKTALCDPLPQIRSIAAMAIGKIASKIGASAAKQYFSFIYDIIGSPASNTTQKTGAAQAYAQVLCSQGYEYFQQSLNEVFAKLAEPGKSLPKQGYILVFLYVPGIRREQFQSFIKQVNQNTYCYVSDEDQGLRNSSMQVSKVLINNYGISHTDLMLQPLCQGIFSPNWRKRNAALILLGQLLNILKIYMFNTKDYSKNQYYYQALMAVYIQKDDQLQMPRQTANFVWNTYIQNTPKTIRSGLHTLVKMWTKFTHAAEGVVQRNITGFSMKYGQNYFVQIFEFLQQFAQQPEHKQGVFNVLGQLFKRLTQQFLSKPAYKTMIRKFFQNHIFTIDGNIRKALTDCLSLYVQKMHEQQYFQNLIYPSIDKMSQLNQQNPEYTNMLHLVRDLLHNTSSNKVIDRLITKVTSPPLSQFKIEVITNNTDKIANNLYSSFKTPATQSMLEEILTIIDDPSKSNRLDLLVYCMNQVSIKLTNKYKNMYINMLIKNLRTYKNKKNQLTKQIYQKIIDKLLDMLVHFLDLIQLDQIQSLQQLIGQISPHIFDGTDTTKANAHKIFMLLISDHKSSKTGSYYKQMMTSLENQRSQTDNRNIVIWNQEVIIKSYVNILVKGLVYGNNDNIEDNIQMTKFLIKNADKKILNQNITKILGPIIRVSSYPLYYRQKQKLLQFIKNLYIQGYNGALQVYNYQIVSVCLRLLNQTKLLNKKNSDLTDQLAKTLFFVITKQSNIRSRELLVNFIMDKAKGQILAEIIYRLLDEIIQESGNTKNQILPVSTYKKIKEKFVGFLYHSQQKLTVKGIYYLSKVISLVQITALKQQPKPPQIITFQDLILTLQRSYYKKEAIPKLDKVELLIKQSPRQKVYYILKSIHECSLANTRTEEVYSGEYVRSVVPEALSGFEDIVEILQYFD